MIGKSIELYVSSIEPLDVTDSNNARYVQYICDGMISFKDEPSKNVV